MHILYIFEILLWQALAPGPTRGAVNNIKEGLTDSVFLPGYTPKNRRASVELPSCLKIRARNLETMQISIIDFVAGIPMPYEKVMNGKALGMFRHLGP